MTILLTGNDLALAQFERAVLGNEPVALSPEARERIADGTIHGGMIPKVETCLEAVEAGVEAAVIVDGRLAHAILLELFTEGAGTLIRGG